MRVLHPQFRDENADSKYPFTDSSSLTTSEGHQLGENWLLDALLYPPTNIGPLAVLSIHIDGEFMTVSVGNTSSGEVFCTGTISLATTPDGSVAMFDVYDRPAGVLLADPNALTALRQFAIGTVNFAPGTADFVASVVVPAPEPGVRDFADRSNPPLPGDVWLVGENGVQVTKTTEGYVQVDIVGEPLFVRLTCANTAAFTAPIFLKTINGIPGTYWGGFTLQLGRVLSSKPALRIFVENDTIMIGLALPTATG